MGLESVSQSSQSGFKAKATFRQSFAPTHSGYYRSPQWLLAQKNAHAKVHAHRWIRSLHDCRYPPSTGGSAGRDGDEELHQALVDVAGGGGLDNEDIFVADRLADGEGGFLVRVVEGDGPSDLDSESATRQNTKRVRDGSFVVGTDGAMRDIGIIRDSRQAEAYRFATFSLSSGWLLPLMSLISFAISPDMLSRSRRTRQIDDRASCG